MGKLKIQIQRKAILMQRILCRYGRKEYASDKRIYKKSTKRR